MRAATNQANSLQNNASSTAAGFGNSAANISSTLTPFLTRELNAPAGQSQQDLNAELVNAEGGAGGVMGDIATKADEKAGATGNEAGFSSELDDAARERMKAAASTSAGIASKNAELKQQQQQEGAEGLRGMYGTDVGAQLGALGVQNSAINTEANAGKSGWFQNMNQLIQTLRGGGGGSGGADSDGMGG